MVLHTRATSIYAEQNSRHRCRKRNGSQTTGCLPDPRHGTTATSVSTAAFGFFTIGSRRILRRTHRCDIVLARFRCAHTNGTSPVAYQSPGGKHLRAKGNVLPQPKLPKLPFRSPRPRKHLIQKLHKTQSKPTWSVSFQFFLFIQCLNRLLLFYCMLVMSYLWHMRV